MTAVDLRLTITVQCGCHQGRHQATAYRTATPGLVAAQWTHPTDPQRHGRWTVIHYPTGLNLPCDYGDPESAQAAAATLTTLGDWTVDDPTTTIDEADVITAMEAAGGEPHTASSGQRRRVNP